MNHKLDKKISFKGSEGKVSWRSPSNIALVKYWGKYGNQLPKNPSISFTLSKSYTETEIHFEKLEYNLDQPSIQFYFEGKPNELFEQRIFKYLKKNFKKFPSIKKLHLSIDSSNSFPHSAGIASSASAMSALILCLCSIEQHFSTEKLSPEKFFGAASFFSRLASGSACRSVYGPLVLWGKDKKIANSANEFAIPITKYHEIFSDFRDAILIISNEVKSVSSSAGHNLMNSNPFAEVRYSEARRNARKLLSHLQSGDVFALGEIVEQEALMLHALMMCSSPSFILMKANTLNVIDKIQQFRIKSGNPVFFTLDAGPNIHLLYPKSISQEMKQFIKSELLQYCENRKVIFDRVGFGPK